MNCPRCGNLIKEGEKFCLGCGMQLSDITLQSPTNNQPISNNENNQAIQNSNVIPNESMMAETYNSTPAYNDNFNNNESHKKNSSLVKVIAIVLSVAAICGVGYFATTKLLNKNSGTSEISEESEKSEISKYSVSDSLKHSSAFFLKNTDGKYAMFNSSGKQLSDFIFKIYNENYYGTFLVYTETHSETLSEVRVGIISESGEMLVDFNKYSYIYARGSLYELYNTNDVEHKLINSSGKTVGSLKAGESLSYIVGSPCTILKDSESYSVLDYNGDKLLTFQSSKSDVADPIANVYGNYMSIFYDNKNYVIDVTTGKKIIEFSDDKPFSINQIDKNDTTKMILIRYFETYQNVNEGFKYVENGKVKFESSDKCAYHRFIGNDIVCGNISGESSIFDNSGTKISLDLSTSIKGYKAGYYNSNSYIKQKEDNSIDFYQNNKLVKNVKCHTISSFSSGIYLLRIADGEKCGMSKDKNGFYQYYKSNGELLNNELYNAASAFNIGGLAEVSKFGKSSKSYLINKSGKKASYEYSYIASESISNESVPTSEFYVATKNDKKVLLDPNGKEIISGDYTETRLYKIGDKIYLVSKEDSKYALYDLKDKKQILSSPTSLKLYDNYIESNDGNKTKYYLYTGKLFYEK